MSTQFQETNNYQRAQSNEFLDEENDQTQQNTQIAQTINPNNNTLKISGIPLETQGIPRNAATPGISSGSLSSSRKFQGQDESPIPILAKVIVSPRLGAGMKINSSSKIQSQNNNPWMNKQHSYHEPAAVVQDKPVLIDIKDEQASNTIPSQQLNSVHAVKTQSNTDEDDDYEQCPNCTRKFFSGRLVLHLKICKPNKPVKRLKKAEQLVNTAVIQKVEQQTLQSEKVTSALAAEAGEGSGQVQQTVVETPKIAQKVETNENHQDKNGSPTSIEQPALDEQEQEEDKSKQSTSQQQPQQATYSINEFEQKIADMTANSSNQQEDNRVACSNCGRKFMPDRVEKHQSACTKQKKTRAVFNSTAARCPEDENGNKLIPKGAMLLPPKPVVANSKKTVQIPPELKSEQQKQSSQPTSSQSQQQNTKISTELSSSQVNLTQKTNDKPKEKQKAPKWKLEHEQFIDNLRYNRELKKVKAEGGDISKIAPCVDNLEALGYIQCQYCSRKFAAETAKRHIPLCKNILNRPKPPRQDSRQKTKESDGDNKRNTVKKIPSRKSTSNQEDRESDSILKGRQQFPNDTTTTASTSDQISLYSNNTTDQNSVKSRTGVLPDLKLKPKDKKFLTSQKFTNLLNKSANGETPSAPPPPPTKIYEDIYTRTSHINSVPCPYCSRMFAKNAADRHIPICKNILNRPNAQAVMRNTRQSLPKKAGLQLPQYDYQSQQESKYNLYSQRQSLGATSSNVNLPLNPQSPRNIDRVAVSDSVSSFQKPHTSDSIGVSRIAGKAITRASNFCGFCGFQFANEHKYCGSCGKKRFSTALGGVSTSSNQVMTSKVNLDLPPRPQQVVLNEQKQIDV